MHDHHGHHPHDHPDHDDHHHGHDEHGHSHGLVHESIVRSHEGMKAVSLSLLVLGSTAALQILIFLATNSVSLLADLIHNVGDALTALPLAAAFFLRSKRIEKWAGYFVVATIFVSACVAGFEALERLLHPQQVSHLFALVAAGVIGYIGNEIAALIRLRAGKRLDSPALIADGYHARADGYVSLAVVASALLVALGMQIADPLIGLTITVVILRITWTSYRTIRSA